MPKVKLQTLVEVRWLRATPTAVSFVLHQHQESKGRKKTVAFWVWLLAERSFGMIARMHDALKVASEAHRLIAQWDTGKSRGNQDVSL